MKTPTPMRLSRLLIATLLLALAALPSLHAQADGSPYSVVVPVGDTSEAQRSEAFAAALGQVLTRVAGGQDLRSKAGYNEALGKAAVMVQQFQYARAGGGLTLQVNFEPGAVRRLISTLGVSSAGVKPPVLLLVQGSDGRLLDQAALESLAKSAAAGGVNVVYSDPDNPPDLLNVAAADPATLAALNQKYRTGLVLLGSLRQDSANWTLISGGQTQRWNNRGSTEDALLADAGSGVAHRVSQQLNVVSASVSTGRLWVSGMASAMDYANLLSLLDDDPLVRSVLTLGAQDDGVLLEVKASVPPAALATNLAAGGRLLQGSPHAGADASLRWLR